MDPVGVCLWISLKNLLPSCPRMLRVTSLINAFLNNTNSVWMTPRDYLSYFDPLSDAEMAVTAAKISAAIPVLWVIGDSDYLIRAGREYAFEKLPKNSKSTYLEVSANHVTTPEKASDQIIEWLKKLQE